MSEKRKKYDDRYRKKMVDRGYARLNHYFPQKYKKIMSALIDVFCCHYEDPSSTGEFHDLIELISNAADKLEEEYVVRKTQ